MYITKTQLLNDVIGLENNNNVDTDDLMSIEDEAGKDLVDRKQYGKDIDAYNDAVLDVFSDGSEQMYFVKRDSVLCTALMNFYGGTTVTQFNKAAKKNISGYVSNMTKEYTDNFPEGFFFAAGSDLMDALVPYHKQHKFMETVNPSIDKQIYDNVPHLDELSELISDGFEMMKAHGYSADQSKAYHQKIANIKEACAKLGI